MKKIEYQAPVMEVVKMVYSKSVLLETSSNETPGIGGGSDDEFGG